MSSNKSLSKYSGVKFSISFPGLWSNTFFNGFIWQWMFYWKTFFYFFAWIQKKKKIQFLYLVPRIIKKLLGMRVHLDFTQHCIHKLYFPECVLFLFWPYVLCNHTVLMLQSLWHLMVQAVRPCLGLRAASGRHMSFLLLYWLFFFIWAKYNFYLTSFRMTVPQNPSTPRDIHYFL